MKLRYLYLIMWQFLFLLKLEAKADSIPITLDKFFKRIIAEHPISKRASLLIDLANSEWLEAKGGFDPSIQSGWNQKSFDQKLYYREWAGTLNIPSPIGADLNIGYQRSQGSFVNPEMATDQFGLWNTGIEIQLLQGLVTNQRRTDLKQAKLLKLLRNGQLNIQLNDLLYEAGHVYFNWLEKCLIQNVAENNMLLAEKYFFNTKDAFLGGEKTAVDTLEVYLLLMERKQFLQKNMAELVSYSFKMQSYLWEQRRPSESQVYFPMDTVTNTSTALNSVTINKPSIPQNPWITTAVNEKNIFELDLNLKKEYLKPKLTAKYYPLWSTNPAIENPLSRYHNYIAGFDFSFPLFLRKERAQMRQSEIKIKEKEFDIDFKSNYIFANNLSLENQLTVLDSLINTQKVVNEGFKTLLEAELIKFDAGESSVFLVNKRQEKLLEAEIKLIELQVQRLKASLEYKYVNNLLFP